MKAPETGTPLLNPPALVGEWLTGIRNIHIAHTRAAAAFTFWERALGLGVALFAAASGTTVLSTSTNPTALWIAGVVAISAAMVAAAHTFLGYGALAAEHSAAAKEYGVLRKKFEAKVACGGAADLCAVLEETRTAWNEIEAKYRFVSQRRYAEAQRVTSKRAK